MTKLTVIILLAVVVIIFGPLASIWALNALFPALAIPYTFDTWLGSFILGAVVSGNGLSFKAK